MKKLSFIVLTALLMWGANFANAAFLDDTDDLGFDDAVSESEDVLGTQAKPQTVANKKVLSSLISSRIPASSAKNIENAEKVFCYVVDYAPAEYNGYMIDDMAIKGSCGELSNEGKNLVKDALLSNGAVYSTEKANCTIEPKILLRYINGIDSTDVLLSAPCHSLTFFHGGDTIVVSAGPGKDIVEKIVEAYSSVATKFLSPALLDQMVPSAQVVSQDQKEIVRKLEAVPSVKKWGNNNQTAQPTENKVSETAGTASTDKPVRKGWNKLKN